MFLKSKKLESVDTNRGRLLGKAKIGNRGEEETSPVYALPLDKQRIDTCNWP
jgi:hypothetical protein